MKLRRIYSGLLDSVGEDEVEARGVDESGVH